jgi:prophage antirepressor-like protein
MSWDVVLFSSTQKIDSIEEVDESMFIETDFCEVLDTYFAAVKEENDSVAVNDKDYSIDYYADDEPVSNKMVSLYGENALYELVIVAKKQGWQIFDTSLNAMIDLENPANNGYENFQLYLKKILE